MTVADKKERLQALDSSQSFIVQAPAGSGKTELLTQRFLVLLASVHHAPEEVVAITFTRKAAAEMRARIFDALYKAATLPPPNQEHSLQTWQLAKKVIDRDSESDWNLLQNPNRLRVTTIDALCARIAKSAPLISNFGSLPQVVEDAFPFYKEAVYSFLGNINENQSWTAALADLLLHLDNNYLIAEKLFVAMLSRRDQWLPYIMQHRNTDDSRKLLEASLQNIITDNLKSALKHFNKEDKEELIILSCFAAKMVKDIEKKSAISACENLLEFPSAEIKDLKQWMGIAQLLLTSAFEWRRAVNKNCGFPAPSSAISEDEENLFKHMKARIMRLLNRFNQNESLRLDLKNILSLPSPCYAQNQWEIVKALTEVLPILVAHLHLIFREHNVTDFIAVAQGAIHALGDPETPSDIALNLDYQIQHLLVDEFQDTSLTQFRLFELLTAGWQRGDGRTLFLVGDPMQSIYRFREAEVGIFLKVKKYGLGAITLIPLTLKVNFRSQPQIIEWVNNAFSNMFPSEENIELGAIPFSSAVAFENNSMPNANVYVNSLSNPELTDEADQIVHFVSNELTSNPKKSIAILVRSRSHLQNIIPALKRANILFNAVEIEKLIYSTAVQDLFALTRALSHLADRVAWLAILRAPWCGLDLRDLYLVANHNKEATLWQTLQQYNELIGLSEQGRLRLARIIPILSQAISERSRHHLKSWIAYTWYALGGPACIDEEHELHNTESYLSLLNSFDDYSQLDFNLLEQNLADAYAKTISSNANVHLMTIHKAKGLEFDVVILPSLERKPAIDESRLLVWLERQNSRGQMDLVLAPIKSVEDEFDPIYRYVRNQNTQKSQYEVVRLLYVAATRAKEKLYLIGSQYSDDNEEFKDPSYGSFLNLLWQVVKPDFSVRNKKVSSTEKVADETSPFLLKRLALNWQLTTPLPALSNAPQLSGNYSFEWRKEYLNHVGTVIHRFLQKLTMHNNYPLEHIELNLEHELFKKQLLQQGVTEDNLSEGVTLIKQALHNILTDPRGKWILSPHHQARSEYAINIVTDNEIKHCIIDRTFVDDQGIRWIIDYKTSALLQENEMFFIAKAKARYAEQLENYAKVIKLLENRPIKLGLYFPLFSGWCEWDYSE